MELLLASPLKSPAEVQIAVFRTNATQLRSPLQLNTVKERSVTQAVIATPMIKMPV